MHRLFLLTLLLCSFAAPAGAELLEVNKAFRFSARALDDKTLEVRYDIADGYYLYRDKFKFALEPPTATPGTPELPPGKIRKDEFFGEVETYRGSVAIKLPISAAAALDSVLLKVTSQGCADVGVCYPPNPQSAKVTLAAFSPAPGASVLGGLALAPGTPGPAGFSSAPAIGAPSASPAPQIDAALPAASKAQGADESSRLARLLKHASFWLVITTFFGAGLLLSLTPCVFPMIPILSGIIVGHGHNITRWRAFALSSAYVLGMALTYALAGIGAGLSGSLLSSALQNPWVLGGFALVFVALSLSMFGLYELQLPAFLQSKVSAEANRQKGGSLHGVALMGALSAIIVGPCVAAPLAGALLYIAQTRDALLGGAALFFMALGMGAPLIAVGVSARHLMPHGGPWMEGVKKFFGVAMLALAIWLVSPVIPAFAHMLAWAGLLIVSAVFLSAIDPLPPAAHGWARLRKGIGIVILLAGAILMIGALGGSRDPLQPLDFLRGNATRAEAPAHFERVKTVAELDARLAATTQPVMLDFYADWCVSCKEMERYTFADPRVRARLAGMLLLQADVTENSAADKALLARFQLFGPPGIVFFDAKGKEIGGVRVIGYMAADEFLGVLGSVLGA